MTENSLLSGLLSASQLNRSSKRVLTQLLETINPHLGSIHRFSLGYVVINTNPECVTDGREHLDHQALWETHSIARVEPVPRMVQDDEVRALAATPSRLWEGTQVWDGTLNRVGLDRNGLIWVTLDYFQLKEGREPGCRFAKSVKLEYCNPPESVLKHRSLLEVVRFLHYWIEEWKKHRTELADEATRLAHDLMTLRKSLRDERV